jgi:hypothetical protein
MEMASEALPHPGRVPKFVNGGGGATELFLENY